MSAVASTVSSTASTHALSPRLPAPALDIDAVAAHVPVLRRRLLAGQHLFRAGQPFRALYFVHAGFLRTSLVTSDGREQVTGFSMRGDLLGAESIGSATHVNDVVALDTCEIVELPYPAVLAACLAVPQLHGALMQALATELRRDRSWMLAIGTLSAERRVAGFLLDLAERYKALGFSASHFVLRMSRVDIGNFLALKHETVTRALSHLAATGLIEVDRREIRIRSTSQLEALACGCGDEARAA
ncbi:Crp/Fnr family transcriptional regulator [Tahibacter soli]|jgi:CRP/FNR family transcriptional regulator|uniref:CRP-like protein Clp n=1 Tax=Tahibacter soli TaxID=2983605 RepID=A0A9X4BHY6_9GAMM|nr:cyclic nucleotide-binding domain-containing protein [Tahibacter soli]MDC8011667.1 helix-turn-helix domain-containing protein [Tahibacter soli]